MKSENEPPRWTTVDRFFVPTDAHIAAGRLEAEGIPVFLLGVNHASANWLIANALGGIQLQVPAKYVDDARKLLAEQIAAEEGGDQCPDCGSTDLSRMNSSQKVAFLTVHILNLPLPWKKKQRLCNVCGHEWEPD